MSSQKETPLGETDRAGASKQAGGRRGPALLEEEDPRGTSSPESVYTGHERRINPANNGGDLGIQLIAVMKRRKQDSEEREFRNSEDLNRTIEKAQFRNNGAFKGQARNMRLKMVDAITNADEINLDDNSFDGETNIGEAAEGSVLASPAPEDTADSSAPRRHRSRWLTPKRIATTASATAALIFAAAWCSGPAPKGGKGVSTDEGSGAESSTPSDNIEAIGDKDSPVIHGAPRVPPPDWVPTPLPNVPTLFVRRNETGVDYWAWGITPTGVANVDWATHTISVQGNGVDTQGNEVTTTMTAIFIDSTDTVSREGISKK